LYPVTFERREMQQTGNSVMDTPKTHVL